MGASGRERGRRGVTGACGGVLELRLPRSRHGTLDQGVVLQPPGETTERSFVFVLFVFDPFDGSWYTEMNNTAGHIPWFPLCFRRVFVFLTGDQVQGAVETKSAVESCVVVVTARLFDQYLAVYYK